MSRCTLVLASLLLWATQAFAQDYPTRAVRVVVPFPAGGGTDVLARIIGQKLHEKWGQPFVIENSPGASGGVGTRTVARAEPDGYTLLMASTGALMAAASMLGGEAAFDVSKHFAPIALAAAPPYIVTVTPKLPVGSLADFIRLAREKPESLTYGSSGVGAASHLSAELFQSLAGIKMLHVPYRGTGPAVTDLISGRLDLMFAPPQTVQPLVQAGELKALATTGGARSRLYPDLPTLAESGVNGYEAVGWFGLLAPAGTPASIVDRLHGEITAMMNSPDVRERLASLGAEAQSQTPQEFGRYINDDIAKWTRLVRENRIVMPGTSGSSAQ